MKRHTLSAVIILGLLAATPRLSANTDTEKGKNLYSAGDYEPAKQIFVEILSQRSDDETALYYLGRIHLDHSDLDSAKEYFERLAEIEPDNSEYQLRLGEVYGEKARTSSFFMSKKKWAGKWKKQLELAFELDPQNLDARERLSIYLLNAPGIGGGDKDRGTQIAQETLEIDESFGHLLLAYAYRRTGRIDPAIGEYEIVLGMDSENDRAYRGLGYAYVKQEEFEKAEAKFRMCIEIAPDDANSYQAMAYYYSQRGSTEGMRENQEKALELKPLLSDTRYALAKNYQEIEMNSEAIYHYEHLLALTPKHHKAGSAKKRLKELKNPRSR